MEEAAEAGTDENGEADENFNEDGWNEDRDWGDGENWDDIGWLLNLEYDFDNGGSNNE